MPFGGQMLFDGKIYSDGQIYDDMNSYMLSGNADKGNATDFFNELGQGLMNAWYDLTGQHEKTSFYQTQIERENELLDRQEAREDSANQRAVADMRAAGISPYQGVTAAGSASRGSQPSSGSESIQRMAAAIDMRKALAEIGNVQANTNKQNAEAAATTAGIERDDNYYQLSALKNASEIARNDVLNELTKTQTEATAESIVSSIQQRTRDNELHVFKLVAANVDNQLKYKDLNVFDESHEAEMAVKRTSAYLNQMKAGEAAAHTEEYQKNLEKIQAEIERQASEIARNEAEINHLSYQDQVLLQDFALKCLEYEVNFYNYEYSQEAGLRTTDQASKFMNFNLTQFRNSFGDRMKEFWHDLNSPIWKWSIFK